MIWFKRLAYVLSIPAVYFAFTGLLWLVNQSDDLFFWSGVCGFVGGVYLLLRAVPWRKIQGFFKEDV